MAIRRQAFAPGFLPVSRSPSSPLQVSPRIHARRRMGLEVHEVIGSEEVVEADLEEIGRGEA